MLTRIPDAMKYLGKLKKSNNEIFFIHISWFLSFESQRCVLQTGWGEVSDLSVSCSRLRSCCLSLSCLLAADSAWMTELSCFTLLSPSVLGTCRGHVSLTCPLTGHPPAPHQACLPSPPTRHGSPTLFLVNVWTDTQTDTLALKYFKMISTTYWVSALRHAQWSALTYCLSLQVMNLLKQFV